MKITKSVFLLSFVGNKIACSTRCRAKERFPGDFGLPGGKVDEGETLAQAAKREAKEEGWDIDVDNPYLFFSKYIAISPEETMIVYWMEGKNPKRLDDYKEKNRGIKPILKTIEQVLHCGYHNDEALFSYSQSVSSPQAKKISEFIKKQGETKSTYTYSLIGDILSDGCPIKLKGRKTFPTALSCLVYADKRFNAIKGKTHDNKTFYMEKLVSLEEALVNSHEDPQLQLSMIKNLLYKFFRQQAGYNGGFNGYKFREAIKTINKLSNEVIEHIVNVAPEAFDAIRDREEVSPIHAAKACVNLNNLYYIQNFSMTPEMAEILLTKFTPRYIHENFKGSYSNDFYYSKYKEIILVKPKEEIDQENLKYDEERKAYWENVHKQDEWRRREEEQRIYEEKLEYRRKYGRDMPDYSHIPTWSEWERTRPSAGLHSEA